ncbi:MAG TPA: hypothetical protein VMV34_01340 [Terriglobia bacterium]|nr:hypothetical protein [Terriglobia bacterium]
MSANHRRVLSVRMRLLEDYCCQLLELFRPAEPGGASGLFLPPEKAEKVESALRDFRSRIGRIKAELDLEHIHQNARREAVALVATMITNVEELHPHYLKGYGTVPEPLARYLQGCLEGLEDALEAANRILVDDHGESPAES